MPELDENTPDQGGKSKRKDRVRSVWISFIGRIVAQIIGAIASAVLGIFHHPALSGFSRKRTETPPNRLRRLAPSSMLI